MPKKWIALLAGIIVILGILIFVDNGRVKYSEEDLSKLNEELDPYENQKNQLEREIRKLESEAESVINGMGNIVFLFKSFDEEMYADIESILEENRMEGTFVLSKNAHPGLENYISKDQFTELIIKGWKYCIAWEETDTPEEWYAYWNQKLAELELVMPKAVCFQGDSYSEDVDEFLLNNGFEVIVQPGKSGNDIITTGCDEKLWHLYSMGWNGNKAKALMKTAVSKGGTLVFTVGEESNSEKYNKETFASMVNSLSDYVGREKLQIIDILAAKDYESVVSSDALEKQEEISKQIEKLKNQLKEVESEIDKLYEKYNGKK